jgi:hypothetical protein
MTFEMFTKMASGFIHRLVNLINGRLQSNFSHSCASSFFGGKISTEDDDAFYSLHFKLRKRGTFKSLFFLLPLVTFTAHFLLCIGVTAFLAVACQLSSLQQPKEKKKDPHIVTSLCIPILSWKYEGHILLKVELRYPDCRASLIQPLENRRER